MWSDPLLAANDEVAVESFADTEEVISGAKAEASLRVAALLRLASAASGAKSMHIARRRA